MDTWHDALGGENSSRIFQEILNAVRQNVCRDNHRIRLTAYEFNAVCPTAFDRVKAVILGQDPYHGQGRLTVCHFPSGGYPDIRFLLNIYKELVLTSIAFPFLCTAVWQRGGAGRFASEHVFDSACRTVAFSHALLGWERFIGTL